MPRLKDVGLFLVRIENIWHITVKDFYLDIRENVQNLNKINLLKSNTKFFNNITNSPALNFIKSP